MVQQDLYLAWRLVLLLFLRLGPSFSISSCSLHCYACYQMSFTAADLLRDIVLVVGVSKQICRLPLRFATQTCRGLAWVQIQRSSLVVFLTSSTGPQHATIQA